MFQDFLVDVVGSYDYLSVNLKIKYKNKKKLYNYKYIYILKTISENKGRIGTFISISIN